MLDFTVTDPDARSRAATYDHQLCPACADSGVVFAGTDLYSDVPPFCLSSWEFEKQQAHHLKGPWAPCPRGCKTPQEIVRAQLVASVAKECAP